MAKYKPIRITKEMNINDLRAEVERANKIYNNRIKALRKSKLSTLSPSYYITGTSGKREARKVRHVKTSVLSREQLEKEYLNFNDFLDNLTSTPAGVRKYRQKMRKKLADDENGIFTDDLSSSYKRRKAKEKESKFWEMYNNAEENLKANLPSKRLVKMLRRITKQKHLSEQEKVDLFNKYLQEMHHSLKNGKFTLNDNVFFSDNVKK